MSVSENMVRRGQLIGAFGAGSFVDFTRRSVIVSGLGEWQKRPGDRIAEPRLIEYLRREMDLPELQLASPPAYDPAPDRPKFGVAGIIFPTWFVTMESVTSGGRRLLVGIDATENHGLTFRDPASDRKFRLAPTRFVIACRRGHTTDVDWRVYVHRGQTDCRRQLWVEEHGTSGEVADTWVGCDCGQQRNLYDALDTASRPLGTCNGPRPWLGLFKNEPCGQPNRLLVRSASNAYFGQTISAISLPDTNEALGERLADIFDLIKNVESDAELAMLKKLQPPVRAALEGVPDHDVLAHLQARRDGGGPTTSVKEAEFDVLVSGARGRDERGSPYFAELLERSEWDPDHAPYLASIERVVLVHRLRKVTVQVGFTRFEALSTDVNGELDSGVERQGLAETIEWLPAVEHLGEGFFLQISASGIERWLERDAVIERADSLEEGYRRWAAERQRTRPFVGAPFIMLHSFAHLIITAIALDCGYPATSLCERVYSLGSGKYGILIHTGSSGSEGTLGGVVEAGRHLNIHVKRALQSALLCSNDPICSDHVAPDPHENRFLHGAACHGCLLIAETSCEHRNDLLDRALVVPTVACKTAAFFPIV